MREHPECCFYQPCLAWTGRKEACDWLAYLHGNDSRNGRKSPQAGHLVLDVTCMHMISRDRDHSEGWGALHHIYQPRQEPSHQHILDHIGRTLTSRNLDLEEQVLHAVDDAVRLESPLDFDLELVEEAGQKKSEAEVGLVVVVV